MNNPYIENSATIFKISNASTAPIDGRNNRNALISANNTYLSDHSNSDADEINYFPNHQLPHQHQFHQHHFANQFHDTVTVYAAAVLATTVNAPQPSYYHKAAMHPQLFTQPIRSNPSAESVKHFPQSTTRSIRSIINDPTARSNTAYSYPNSCAPEMHFKRVSPQLKQAFSPLLSAQLNPDNHYPAFSSAVAVSFNSSPSELFLDFPSSTSHYQPIDEREAEADGHSHQRNSVESIPGLEYASGAASVLSMPLSAFPEETIDSNTIAMLPTNIPSDSALRPRSSRITERLEKKAAEIISSRRKPSPNQQKLQGSEAYMNEVVIGIYSRSQREEKILRYREKRAQRVWQKKILYSCRKNFADQRPRVGGRFIKMNQGQFPAEAKPEAAVEKELHEEHEANRYMTATNYAVERDWHESDDDEI
jgi:hypothetical protein